MFETTAVDNVANRYVDKDVGGGTPGTRLEEADRNIIQDELTKPVTSSGQALDPTGAIRDQLARAMFIYGAAAQSVIDTGGAGAYVVDHVSAAFVVPTAFAEIDGAMAVFIPAVVNAGASTLDYMGLGAKPITDGAGAALAGGEMAGYVMLQYNLTSDRWEVMFSGALYALLASPAFSGNPTAPTQAPGDNSTRLATTAFAQAAFSGEQNFVKQSIVQDGAVATGVVVMPYDVTIPQITEGNEFMVLVHTPEDAANILTITVNNMCSHGSASAGHITSALFRDAVADALAATSEYSQTLDLMSSFSYEFQMVAGGIAPITFRNRIGKNVAGTLAFNGTPSAGLIHGGVAASSIRVVETRP